MPYPNEHSARLRDPGDFKAKPDWSDGGQFRRKADGTIYGKIKVPASVDVIWGQLKNQEGQAAAPQALRFPTKDWTAEGAKGWLKKNEVKYVSFEAARKAEAQSRVPDFLAIAPRIEIQAAEKDAGTNAPRRFTLRAYNGGLIEAVGFWLPVIVDLAGLHGLNKSKPVLRDHDKGRIVGHAEARRTGDPQPGLEATGVISGAGPDAAEVLASYDNGFPWRISIGCQLEKVVELAAGETAKANGREVTGPCLIARKASLREMSFVPLAADENTYAEIAAEAASDSSFVEILPMTFEEWLTERDFGLADLKEKQQASLRAMYDQEQQGAKQDKRDESKKGADGPDDKDDPDAKMALKAAADQAGAAIRTAAAMESERIAKIRECFAGRFPKLEAAAIKERWTDDKCELEKLRAERPTGPAIHGSNRDQSPKVLEAAFCRTAGLRTLEKQFDAKILEQSEEYRNLGIQDLLLLCAETNGYNRRRMRLASHNLREVLEAAFSTHTITTLLTQTGSKFLLEGFNAIPQSWREVAGVRPVVDFKTVTAFRLTAALEYEEVGPAGEIKHGTLGQESYTMAAKTYAKMMALTRQDIINDDLGAFDDLRNRLGMGAAIKMNKVFWTAWLAASAAGTFWTSGRGNYQSGAATVLADAGLNTAVKLFRDAAGPDGNLLGLEPVKLLVPSDLEATARKFYVSQEMRDMTASSKTPVANIYFNRFKPVVVPELSNSAYTGYSATAWWLLCDPAVLASAVMCFLNGVQAPTIESADADFDTLGIQYRGYHDFGVAMTEYRASIKSAGA